MKWFAQRRKRLVQEIATEVVYSLQSQRGWKKFLAPVAMRDSVYFVTEDGEIWRMRYDSAMEMEILMKVSSGL